MGDYTLKQVIGFTYMYFKSRFAYKERDVVKNITIKQVKQINIKDPSRPQIKYVIESKSYPQYGKYKPKTKGAKTQKNIAHYYDVVLEMDEMSLSTTNWVLRVGSGKKWQKKPSQNLVKTLYPETKKRLKKLATVKKNTTYKQLVEKHKKNAKYIDVGDYNSQVLGLNGDWIFRCDYPYYFHGHRFGRNYYGNIPTKETNPKMIVFLPKHALNIVEILMKKGILKP